jgi:hypothetical protein
MARLGVARFQSSDMTGLLRSDVPERRFRGAWVRAGTSAGRRLHVRMEGGRTHASVFVGYFG